MTEKDPYQLQETAEKASDFIVDEKPIEAILMIAATFEVDLYDLGDAIEMDAERRND